jgi:hypothetical protein
MVWYIKRGAEYLESGGKDTTTFDKRHAMHQGAKGPQSVLPPGFFWSREPEPKFGYPRTRAGAVEVELLSKM